MMLLEKSNWNLKAIELILVEVFGVTVFASWLPIGFNICFSTLGRQLFVRSASYHHNTWIRETVTAALVPVAFT